MWEKILVFGAVVLLAALVLGAAAFYANKRGGRSRIFIEDDGVSNNYGHGRFGMGALLGLLESVG